MQAHPPSAAPRGTPCDRLVAVQAVLGLTLPDLAAALHISTPRLRQLMSRGEGARPLPQPEAERFDVVERVAMAWQARSAAPMRAAAHLPMANGRTGLVLLVAETVTDRDLTAALDEPKAMLEARPKSPNQLPAEAGYGRRPAIRALPSDA